MNDLMDSLADEDPLVPAGLLSTKLGSSLYTKLISNSVCVRRTKCKSSRSPSWKEGKGCNKI